jgi:dTDP-glucose 4,6-dehydratase
MTNDLPVPIYGDGLNVRDWLFVEDHCAALESILQEAVPGAVYGISEGMGRSNLELLSELASAVDQALNRPAGTSQGLFTFVEDRPGHDRRYALSSRRLRQDLGWRPITTFEDGLKRTVSHYLEQR